ncbi:VanZ family protein [Ornithinimicrobium tianjinense]|uniref:VanZ like family protein n=1 Tax=Ornithinimicrobium tianjinense TaxID=1195761 RepID=A0A917F5Q3_9MICO|nr:VanZ family protein [Ornithinimicrobium tianjinense]GGF50750.1 hypothetical protein GCM10011366_18230 [Ornithinimicrobium tianjinense]
MYAPSVPGPGGVPGLDKVAHLLLFALPSALAWLLGARWVVTLLVVHALVSEPLQGWVSPLRQADPWDTVADLAGVVLGVVVARWPREDGHRP